MVDKYTTKKTRIALVLLLVTILFLFVLSIQKTKAFTPVPPPSLSELDTAISKAQTYYEGLYRPMGKDGAVVAEYYTKSKSVYTVRHGVIGGIFYYSYINDTQRENELLKFVTKYGFNPFNDDHSFVWTDKTTAPIGLPYSTLPYHDCDVTLPTVGKVSAYHSKVCKLGQIGIDSYLLLSRFDPLPSVEVRLQDVGQGVGISTKSLEDLYDSIGFGLPMCSPLGCTHYASTIRTAQFGELEMRINHMQYADSVAHYLLKAQNDKGAIYISYDKNGNLVSNTSLAYSLIDKALNDKPLTHDFIPSNAETMNDSLAFLLHYRCARYGVCN